MPFILTRILLSSTTKSRIIMPRVLNVAEKNDAAKRIAGLLSGGSHGTNNGPSLYNKIYNFNYTWPLTGQSVVMHMTSVSGHVLGYEFSQTYRAWQSCNPIELFDAPVGKQCTESSQDVKNNLEHEAAYSHILVIWTDGDREGENIGYQIIDICKGVNPRLTVFRAKFSEITPTAITRAIHNLEQPNKRISDAVDVRQILDLRIGAAFTRFQTLRLQKKFPSTLSYHIISYGSCQFPTLGFVVERYKAIQDFIPEEFWKLHVEHKVTDDPNCGSMKVEFSWARVRLFNQLAVSTLLEKCLDSPMAKVVKVTSKPKSKWRPVALDTIEFEKLSSRKLKISAKEAMKIAEKLYTSGLISYPRTETNIFPKGLHLGPLIQEQAGAGAPWSDFATRLAASQSPNPRNGSKSDQAHPPIHPTKYSGSLTGNDKRIYELIVRHFLACVSKDALGQETTVEIEIAEERFIAHGLIILERNYLEVYPYDKWSDKELPRYTEGSTFRPNKIEMIESATSPPSLLTEADLIALMEKHGIGTDATHADHIEKVKGRMYVGVQNDGKFIPGQLGMGLVEGYDAMGFQMSKPHLRAELEADLKKIIDGTKSPDAVLNEQVAKYKAVFVETVRQVTKLDEAIGQYLNNQSGGGGGGGAGAGGPAAGGRMGDGGGGGTSDSDSGNDSDGFGGGGPGLMSRARGGRARGRGGRGSSSTARGAAGGGGFQSSTGGYPPQHQQQQQSDGGNAPLCNCRIPTIQLTTKKQNDNYGRRFYKCADDACGYFKWYDAVHPNEPFVPGQIQPRSTRGAGGGGFSSNRGGSRGGGGGGRRPRTTQPRTRRGTARIPQPPI